MALIAGDDGSSSDNSDNDGFQPMRAAGSLASAEDPRTISQIKRSRIDLSRRYVFLCPTSLSKHFDALPHQAKDSALLVFRCSRQWLLAESSSTRADGIVTKIDTGSRRRKHREPAPGLSSSGSSRASLAGALYRNEFSREFLQWVLTKEKEGCVFWYKPERDLYKLSAFFEEKIDPVNELPYRPLLLDPQWWRVRFQRAGARYIGSPSAVVAAISEANATHQTDAEGLGLHPDCARAHDIDIPVLQELIYQSNPTLEPISKWPHAPSMRFLPRAPKSMADFPGHEHKSLGFIEGDQTAFGGTPGRAARAEQARICRWPGAARDRFDNLHLLWQSEEASVARRNCFALHGLSAVSAASAPASAR